MERTHIIGQLSALRPKLEAEGVTHVAIFGSRARGDFRPDSDVDLLLDVDPGSRFSILNLVGVEQLVNETTGLKANAFLRRSLDRDFRDSVRKDLIEVF